MEAGTPESRPRMVDQTRAAAETAGSTADPGVELEKGGGAGQAQTVIVVGFDRSAASLAALGKAADLGRRLGADLHIVHAVDLADYPIDPDADDWEAQATTTLESERHTVSVALVGYPYGWSYLALRAEPAQALARTAERFDALMIVVGVRSAGWRHLLERLAAPSVSHRLIAGTDRPVLVVAHHGAD